MSISSVPCGSSTGFVKSLSYPRKERIHTLSFPVKETAARAIRLRWAVGDQILSGFLRHTLQTSGLYCVRHMPRVDLGTTTPPSVVHAQPHPACAMLRSQYRNSRETITL